MVELSAKLQHEIRCAADIIRQSKRAAVLTGAGISTHSGIPDFRSPHSGLWEHYDPLEVASLQSFRYNPSKFYTWLQPLAMGIAAAKPNIAHLGIAKLEQGGYVKTVITQNIDGLHKRAGSINVLEVHGSFETLTCTSCFLKYNNENYLNAYLTRGEIPYCASCHHVLKPDVILFGEQLPVAIWLKALDESKKCDLMIVAGSSLEVLPVAGLPMRAIENGAHLIIINQSVTYLDVRADVVINDDVAEIIPQIVNEVLDE
jgi:NAD-dependent deacetylase